MKIATISSLPSDREERNKRVNTILKSSADVLIFRGDAGNSREEIFSGLDLLSLFGGLKLACLGNKEMNYFKGEFSLNQNYGKIAEYYGRFGFFLLDQSPMVLDDVGFVSMPRLGGYSLGNLERQSLRRKHFSQIEDKVSKIVIFTNTINFNNDSSTKYDKLDEFYFDPKVQLILPGSHLRRDVPSIISLE